MQDAKKIFGVFMLAAFALVAGSAVCLASGQPSVMTDCGNQMNGAAMCPFMSASIPMVTATILILTLVFVVMVATYNNDRLEAVVVSRFHNSSEGPPISFLNSTLKLISQGILHSRVFDL